MFDSGYPLDSVFIEDGDRSGVDFMVQLDMSWNAPEAFVNMDYAGLHELDIESMPDVLGIRARQPGVAVIRVMTGRYGCHSGGRYEGLCGNADSPGGGGSYGVHWVAADGDAVGGAYGSSNERVAVHCRVLLEWGENVYLSCAHLVDVIRDRSSDWVTCLCR